MILKPVARRGLLCFGPSRGASVTFVKPQQWLGAWREVDPDEALLEVARRYLRAYGPATSQGHVAHHGRPFSAAAGGDDVGGASPCGVALASTLGMSRVEVRMA